MDNEMNTTDDSIREKMLELFKPRQKEEFFEFETKREFKHVIPYLSKEQFEILIIRQKELDEHDKYLDDEFEKIKYEAKLKSRNNNYFGVFQKVNN